MVGNPDCCPKLRDNLGWVRLMVDKSNEPGNLLLIPMVQASDQAPIYRARKGEGTTHPDYRVGDMVDHHRPPSSKDESGWRGPVPITDVGKPGGTVTRKINGQARPCRLADVRFSLLIAVVYFHELVDASSATEVRTFCW